VKMAFENIKTFNSSKVLLERLEELQRVINVDIPFNSSKVLLELRR